MRHQMLNLGVSQMSAGSKTDVGSYYRVSSLVFSSPFLFLSIADFIQLIS
jgi:hypothetical protein